MKTAKAASPYVFGLAAGYILFDWAWKSFEPDHIWSFSGGPRYSYTVTKDGDFVARGTIRYWRCAKGKKDVGTDAEIQLRDAMQIGANFDRKPRCAACFGTDIILPLENKQ